MATSKEMQENLIEVLKRWQKIENGSMSSTSKVLEKTDHPVLRMVLEIIQRDSQLHYNLQQLIIDSMTVKPVALTPDDVAAIWDGIEAHLQLERKTLELAEEALGNLKGKHLTAQNYLLRYLMEDEKKHNFMLDALEQVKKDMYPYG